MRTGPYAVVVTRTGTGFTVEGRHFPGEPGPDHGPLLAWLAARRADVCLLGTLTIRPGARAAVLHLDRGGPIVMRGSMAFHEAGWLAVCAIEAEGTDLATLPEPERLRLLRAATPPADDPGNTIAEAEQETLPALAKACPALATTPAATDAAELRDLQDTCRDLYGRLEPERALAWALEELGELAQAMRRAESTTRIEDRQLREHGAIRPYRRKAMPC
ncbi:hypothetical protein [Actinoplanes sp. NPDC051494]|uniref:hypothetical protein n=1 Tax=Actinoplanes sp. NPDC051494 TaxID=3363907 RepID=UPI003789A5E6